jgi:transaldolase
MKAEEMVKEGRTFSAWGEHVVVKVPMGREGLKAVSMMAREGIRTNVTLIFSPNQALLAARAGATFVSPFVGRLDDISHFGMDCIADIVEIYDNFGIKTEIIAASVRHPLHVIEAAKFGAHIATIPYKVLELMVEHPMTERGIAKFMADWDSLQGKAKK